MKKYLKQFKIVIALALIALTFSSCYVETPRYGYGPHYHHYHPHHYYRGY